MYVTVNNKLNCQIFLETSTAALHLDSDHLPTPFPHALNGPEDRQEQWKSFNHYITGVLP